MPEVVLPLALVDLPCGHVVVDSDSVFHLIDEGALVLVAASVEVAALDECGCAKGLALEAIAVGVVDEGLAYHC